VTPKSDIEICRDLLRGGSRTFFAASLVLPRSVGDRAIALYAFCRLADDEVDLGTGGTDAVARLDRRLAAIYAGQPGSSPADRCFADVVTRFAIPRELPEALLEGLAWDTQSRRYESLSDLIAYAVRVAGAVGAMMALIMERRDPAVVARACDLGIAMQLTNIVRDIGEDARLGRLYLPLHWMREAGLDPDDWLADPRFDRRIGEIARRLLAVADTFYDRAGAGIAALPGVCRPGIHAARLIYAEIGREVERANLDSVSRRAVVPSARKLRLLAEATAVSLMARKAWIDLVQPEALHLIEAVIATPLARAPSPEPRRSVTDRAVWVLDLFERLERRDQLLRSGRAS
jgi:15-cis-phytoene synthase